MESIIVALITGAMSIIGIVITVKASSKQQRGQRQEDLAKQQSEIAAKLDSQSAEIRGELAQYRAATDAKIDALKDEVEKHNGVVERTYRLEEQNKTLFQRYSEVHDATQDIAKTARHAVERADAANNRLDRAGIRDGLS